MYCSKCGKELKEDARFCDGCGTKIGETELKTTQEQTNNKKEIPKCTWIDKTILVTTNLND